MRNYFFKGAVFALLAGALAGLGSAVFAKISAVEKYGGWLVGFYGSVSEDTWGRILFTGTVFVAAVFLLGFFITGHLFILPVDFYFSYTVAYLITAAFRCFGVSALPYGILHLFRGAIYAALLCVLSSRSMEFASEMLLRTDGASLRAHTLKHLGLCFPTVLATVPILFFEWKIAPNILKFLVSF